MEELAAARAVCEPCELMEAVRPGQQQGLQGRRGMLCRILRGGTLKRGDAIIVQAPPGGSRFRTQS